MCSPNTPGLRDLQRRKNLENVLSAVIEARNNLWMDFKPLIFLKLSPDLTSEEMNDIAMVISQEEVYLCR